MDLFAMHFMFLHSGNNFLPDKPDHIQIKSDKMSAEETHHGSVFGLRMVTLPTSPTCLLTSQCHALWELVFQSNLGLNSNFVPLEHIINSNHSWTAKVSLAWPALLTSSSRLQLSAKIKTNSFKVSALPLVPVEK